MYSDSYSGSVDPRIKREYSPEDQYSRDSSKRISNPNFDHIPNDVRQRDQQSRIERLDRMTKNRRKQYRWGAPLSENTTAKLMNLPTKVEITMTPEQLEAYALNFRIEEITQKLKQNDTVPEEAERSPSPTPQYDEMGKRTNTREIRYPNKLQMERHKLVQKALVSIPNYRPPSDYRRPSKVQEKVYIPAKDFPEINFIGLIIGPRGNTLKKMETESGAKIAIRGKGSVKEGKGRSDVPHQQSMDDDLHCLVIADDEDKIQKAKELINGIIETAASTPEEKNTLKRGQLRELAALNGTLRDDESTVCQNCGEAGHKKHECPARKNYTLTVTCRICGGIGHFARDCKQRSSAGYGNSYRDNRNSQPMPVTAADKEYEKLMLELGTGSASSNNDQLRLTNDGGMDQGQQPMRDNQSAPWQRNQNPNFNNGGPPPWQKRGNDGFNNNNNSYQGRDHRDRGDNGRYDNDSYNRNNFHDKRGNDRYGGGYDRERGRYGNRPNSSDSYHRKPQYQQSHYNQQYQQSDHQQNQYNQHNQHNQQYQQADHHQNVNMSLPPSNTGYSMGNNFSSQPLQNTPTAPAASGPNMTSLPPGVRRPGAMGAPPPPPGMPSNRPVAPPPPPGMRSGLPPPPGPPGLSGRGAPPPPPPGTR